MESTSRLRLENIQGLRAIAAIMVVILHAFALAIQFGDKAVVVAIEPVTHALGVGGVDVFFIISGFIIVWVSQRAVGDAAPFSRDSRHAALTFALHRIARIYPLFWITLMAQVLFRLADGHTWPLDDLRNHPGGLVLLSAPDSHAVAWTLVFEVHFYAIAALLVAFAGRHVVSALAVWAVLQVALVAASSIAGGAPYRFFDPMSVELAMGALLAVAMIRRRGHKAPLVAWALAAAAIAGTTLASPHINYPDGIQRILIWGVPAMGLLYGLLVLERERGWLLPAWLRRCGDMSYSLYLWHMPIMYGFGFVVRAWGRKGTLAGGFGYIGLTILLSFIVAALSYRYIERPIMRWVQRRYPSAVAAVRPATAER